MRHWVAIVAVFAGLAVGCRDDAGVAPDASSPGVAGPLNACEAFLRRVREDRVSAAYELVDPTVLRTLDTQRVERRTRANPWLNGFESVEFWHTKFLVSPTFPVIVRSDSVLLKTTDSSQPTTSSAFR